MIPARRTLRASIRARAQTLGHVAPGAVAPVAALGAAAVILAGLALACLLALPLLLVAVVARATVRYRRGARG